jgi:hypothetical protein
VRVQPPDARVFVDARLMGIGDLDLELPGGAYDVMVEAAGYVTRSRRVEVAAEDEIDVAMPLLAPPRSGHTQLVIGTGIFGAASAGWAATSSATRPAPGSARCSAAAWARSGRTSRCPSRSRSA